MRRIPPACLIGCRVLPPRGLDGILCGEEPDLPDGRCLVDYAPRAETGGFVPTLVVVPPMGETHCTAIASFVSSPG